MLIGKNLTVVRGRKTVLTDIDISVQPGQIIGVLGPNGAGKSTLLGALCGELALSSGELLLNNRALSAWPMQERAQHLAVLPQHSTLNFGFTVEQVVAMGRLPHHTGAQKDNEVIRQTMAVADIEHLEGRSYLSLSGGERQRVHLARVLAQLWPSSEHMTLLLDEPTSMLDPLHQHSTLQAVSAFAQSGGAVLVILHDLNLAARYCDQVMLLRDGHCLQVGTPWEVLAPAPLLDAYGLEVLVQAHPERGHPLIISR